MNEGANRLIAYILLIVLFGGVIYFITRGITKKDVFKEHVHIMEDGEVMEGAQDQMKNYSTSSPSSVE